MRKLCTLITGIIVGCAVSQAYTVGVDYSTDDKGKPNGNSTSLWTDDNDVKAASFTLVNSTAVSKTANNNDGTFYDGVRYDYFNNDKSKSPVCLRIGQESGNHGNNYKGNPSSKIRVQVNQAISDVRIYYTGSSNSQRKITVEGFSGVEHDPQYSKYYESSSSTDDKYEGAFIATISNLPKGNYYIYAEGYEGGFCGITYQVKQDVTPPSKEPKDMYQTMSSTTWDFSDVVGSIDFSEAHDTNWLKDLNAQTRYTYEYLLWATQKADKKLTYKPDFLGNCIQFVGQRPIHNSKYAQAGTLEFYCGVPNGAIKVTFTDTGDKANPTARRRYLSVNDNRTDYWVSRPLSTDDDGNNVVSSYESRMDVTTGWIPVQHGWVVIRGAKENGAYDDIRVSKIEFVTFGTNEAVIDDMFTQRIFSDNGKTSTWTYMGYSGGTHALVGGVEDNGIIYSSSEALETDSDGKLSDNGNGNIKFSIDTDPNHSYTQFMRCFNKSSVYVPVPNEWSTGTISIVCTQSAEDRWFDIYVDTEAPVDDSDDTKSLKQYKALPMKSTGSEFSFNSIHITAIKDPVTNVNKYKYYVQLVDNETEMKVLSLSVTLTNDTYTPSEITTDYDHNLGAGHKHALFNFTKGTLVDNVYGDVDKTKGTLTLSDGSMLIGEKIAAADSQSLMPLASNEATATIWSFRGGDLVKYKNKYYGSLQLLANTDYRIEAPDGYYITTSIRLHGQKNKENDSTNGDTYVSNFSQGVFEDSESDDDGNEKKATEFDFPRNDPSARTTTLDFEVPAATSHTFNFSDYQFLGVVDAVMVKKSDVPSVENQVFYTDAYTKEKKALADGMEFESDGVLEYSPKLDESGNPKEELWWYFVAGEDTQYGTRGNLGTVIEDQNYNKSFSVRNYKFVRATGTYTTEKPNDLLTTYTEPSNYLSASDGARSAKRLDTETEYEPVYDRDGKVTLNVKKPGTYYFYIKDKTSNFNSPLVITTYTPHLSGVEDVVVDDDPADDENAPIYNVYGQRVDSSYHGIVIKNGRKYFQR